MKYFYTILSAIILTACMDNDNTANTTSNQVQGAAQIQQTTPSSSIQEISLVSSAPMMTTVQPIQHSSTNEQVDFQFTKTGIANIAINQVYNPDDFINLVKSEDEDPEVPNCFFVYKTLPNNIEFFSMGEKIDAIYLRQYREEIDDPRDTAIIATNESVKIGDNEEKVLKSYDPDKIIKKISDYTEQPIYIYWYDDSVEKTGIRYDIEDGKVYKIILGNKESLELMEGCA